MNFKKINVPGPFKCEIDYRRMFSAYIDGELDEGDRKRLETHFEECKACRDLCSQMTFASRLVSGTPIPASSPKQDGIRRLPAADRRPRSRVTRLVPRAAFAVLIVLAVAGGVWYYTHPSNSPWEVVRLEGNPTIGSRSLAQAGSLSEGQWIETDSSSRAKVTVSNIGEVEVEPNSRVQLVESRVTEHRIALAHGRLKATIWAPPRLFFVDTPSAEAIDLGCAYTLEVDELGKGALRVDAGWVALVLNGRESKVPAGAVCATRPEIGPGTPYFQDAAPAFQRAVEQLDFEGGGSKALDLVIADARVRDTLTLYHLLARVDESDRGRLFDRLASYSPPPEGVTREGICKLDGKMLETWRMGLEPTWLKETMPALRKMWRWIWS
ncbi:MAG TPA: zf-HC2 domain-containing protein [Blastocatellia bacterium]|jgi:predicted anti-sigma-YlaC factor YlaD|nr:zf-HC2 domain-containing protein [Blastocatellia bacterium]